LGDIERHAGCQRRLSNGHEKGDVPQPGGVHCCCCFHCKERKQGKIILKFHVHWTFLMSFSFSRTRWKLGWIKNTKKGENFLEGFLAYFQGHFGNPLKAIRKILKIPRTPMSRLGTKRPERMKLRATPRTLVSLLHPSHGTPVPDPVASPPRT
jgi:hypothetical protein